MRNTTAILSALLIAVSFARAQQPADVERISDVIYTKHDGVALTMDVFRPAKANGAAVVKVISGGWNSNHRGISDGGWPARGYVTFVVVHGTQPRFNVGEIVVDLKRAVRFIRANAAKFGVDPDRIGVTGGSAGGHLSLMLATRADAGNAKSADPVDRVSSAVNAVACFYPPTDFLNWEKEGDSRQGVGPLTTRAPAFGALVATPEDREKAGRDLSPIYHVSAKTPPVYIVQGDADPLVPDSQATRFQSAAVKAGAKCEVLIRKGAAHGGWAEQGAADTDRMAEWFDLHLLGKQPAQPFGFGVSSLPSTPLPKKAAKGK